VSDSESLGDSKNISVFGYKVVMSAASLMSSPLKSAPWRSPQSLYVRMRDGTRIALDVHLPKDLRAGMRVPAVLQFTRYWRACRWADGVPHATGFSEHHALLARGFACVYVDARGSGASFGHRPTEYSADEVADQQEVIRWVACQAWCDGRVLATGVSYAGNTAELTQVGAPDALIAVAPRFTDFDWYEFILFPGGLRNIAFGPDWGLFIAELDAGRPVMPVPGSGGPLPLGVLPVDEDVNGALLDQALLEHSANHRFASISQIECRDDLPADLASTATSANLADLGPQLLAGARPAQHWASWLDSGTAAGALARWRTLDLPMELIIGTWNHGAGMDGDPFLAASEAAVDGAALFETLASFFERQVGAASAPGGSAGIRRHIRYKTMNVRDASGVWHETTVWPPAGVALQRWFAAADGQLVQKWPAENEACDIYTVDFGHGTGRTTRWTTSMSGPVHYADRAEADRRLLTYTSAPLARDLRITGEALVTLHLSSTHDDAAFIVYLEHVSPDGHVRYVTEGQLRAVHRRVAEEKLPYVQAGPARSFRRKDWLPLTPGEITEIRFALLPTSVQFHVGDRIRIAIAGADVDSFERVPADADPTWTVHRSALHATYIDLPIHTRKL
jgi:uncharacterized protein